MDKLLRYIETAAGRERIVKVISTFTLVGGTIVSAIVFTALFLRHFCDVG